MAELKDVLSDMIKAQDKTISALKENRTKINNSVSSLNGAVGDINIENIQVSLVDPGEYTAFEVTAGLTPIVDGIEDAMTHGFQMKTSRQSVGVQLGDTSSIGSYDVVVDWGDGTVTNVSDMTLLGDSDTNDNLNKLKWSDDDASYGYTYADQTLRSYYAHTYTTPGKYIVKILGTTYFHLRHNSGWQKTHNLISRCLEYDLPLYRGLKRIQGAFGYCPQLTDIKCPSYYRWPDELIDCTSAFEGCENLVSVGDMKLPETVRSVCCLLKFCKKLKRGTLVPDRTTNASQMYSGCKALQYIPNIGKNVQNIFDFARGCNNVTQIDGIIPKTVKYAYLAFCQTYRLKHAPDIDPETVFGWADDLDLSTLGEQTYFNLKSVTKTDAIKGMFRQSGIITPPSNLGSVEGSNMSAVQLFFQCQRLQYIPVIPEGITNCDSMCAYCYNLSLCGISDCMSDYLSARPIPTTCTSMVSTFKSCYNLKVAPIIPENVLSCSHTFEGCRTLVDAGQILNANKVLTDISYMFSECSSLVYGPAKMPNTVTTLCRTFNSCFNLTYCEGLNQLPKLTGLTDISYVCSRCYAFNRMYYAIPDSVINADHAFSECFSADLVPYFSKTSNCENCFSMYNGCRTMKNANIRLPNTVTNARSFLSSCANCATDLSLLIHSSFTGTDIDMYNAFYNCSSITGSQAAINTIGTYLWNDANASTKFKNTSTAFTAANSSVRTYIPTSWGGTLSV